MKYFPPYRFDERGATLYRSGRAVPLSRKATALLQCLLASPGTIVTHEKLLQNVWPDTHVQPENIKSVVHELRVALEDHAQPPRFIRSEPGRGYLFAADVTEAMPPLFSDHRRAPEPLLIGREGDFTTLERHFDAAVERCIPQLVLIEGERGIGKTTLCDAFAHVMRERTTVHISYATGLEVWGPVERYAVLSDAFAILARQYPQLVGPAFARHAPTWRARFPTWQDGPSMSDAMHDASDERMLRELSAVLDELAADVPLLIILEDLQWGDAGTIGALKHMTRGHAPGRVCVLATYSRSTPTPTVELLERLARELPAEQSCSVIRLWPLSAGQLREFLEPRVGANVARAVARPLFRGGGGSPMLAVMTVNSLMRSGAITLTAEGWQFVTPMSDIDAVVTDALADGVQCQIDRLSPDEHVLLRAAASIGEEFTSDAVAAAVGAAREVTISRLSALAVRHILIEALGGRRKLDGLCTRFRFRHPLSLGLLADPSGALLQRAQASSAVD